jgi:hypothetical protein
VCSVAAGQPVAGVMAVRAFSQEQTANEQQRLEQVRAAARAAPTVHSPTRGPPPQERRALEKATLVRARARCRLRR